ncbi:hypothetical protein [Chiayiivirga sp.]|jgi:threonyl-tRNA synthetase|uniref:hypothetical protein n=1 Tax=Chiayiivirga sp. TaxID=2041042 RepID=UPI003DA94BA7
MPTSASPRSRSRSRCARTRASGDDATWDKAEDALRAALRACGVEWEELPGEGAFYGPKIEYHMRDSIGRGLAGRHHAGRFHDAGRLGRRIRGRAPSKRHPVMLHRAIVGSMERFIGILIEHHAGHFPVWLAPVQAVVLNITDAQADYAEANPKRPCKSRLPGCGRLEKRKDRV